MLNFKEMEQEMMETQEVNFDQKAPYGTYNVTIANVQRRKEPEKNRERVVFTYRIAGGEYAGVGIRDSFYLSENAPRSTQIFQYKNLRTAFQNFAPEITFDFEDMDDLEHSFSTYRTAWKNILYTIHYKMDNNGFDRVTFEKRETPLFEEEEEEDSHVEELKAWDGEEDYGY